MGSKNIVSCERARDLWLTAAVAISAATGAITLMFLTAAIYSEQWQWPLFIVGLAGILGALLIWERYNRARHNLLSTISLLEGSGSTPGHSGIVDLAMRKMAKSHEEVDRVLRIVTAVSEDLVPVADSFTLDKEDALEEYRFTSTRPGLLASRGLRDRLQNDLSASMGIGWVVKFRPDQDLMIGSRKSDIPKLAMPPMWPVVRSIEEAKTRYNSWELNLGPGEDGDVTIPMQVFPHGVVFASTGGGKSVFLRSCVEQFRAIGGKVLLNDGKGSDYASLAGTPGVVAVGRGSGDRGMEYVAIIELAYRIMKSRQAMSAQRKLQDPAGWRDLPPVFVVMDEMKAVLLKWDREMPSADFKNIKAKVNQILALGREFRIHFLFASQDAYAESIPRTWLTNVGLKISIGKPHYKTIEQGFDATIQKEAEAVASALDPNLRGRGMIAGVNADSGTSMVMPYQSFISYSPGEPVKLEKLESTWDNRAQFKEQVSDAIPRLYSRLWFRVSTKSEAQMKLEAKTEKELGFIDFEMFTPDEISEMPIVNLDMRDPETNEIIPDPEMIQYDPDPNNVEYVCHPVFDESDTLIDI